MIYTTSPGLVIGAGGERIREVTERLKTEFSIENPQIDVQKIHEPDLDPHIVANSIASGLEHRINFKRLGKYHLERVMKAGAVGCEIIIKGKISGEKARKERFVAGYIKKSGEPREKDVIFGRVVANPPLGNIAVNVSIMIKHSDKKIEIVKPVHKEELKEPVKEAIKKDIEEIPETNETLLESSENIDTETVSGEE